MMLTTTAEKTNNCALTARAPKMRRMPAYAMGAVLPWKWGSRQNTAWSVVV
jgi:hypothetical protein